MTYKSPPTLTRRALMQGATALAVTTAQGARAMAPNASPGIGFVAHGAPTLALDVEKGRDLVAWGKALPRPKAILVVSAHFEASPITLSSPLALPLVYDFYGFPRPLYEVKYPAPGAPLLVDAVRARLGGGVTVDEARGLDHGAWTPLVHLFPDASVPVMQLSLPTITDDAQLFTLGERLASLADEGVLLLGSGNLTHNLREVIFDEDAPVVGWAKEFDEWAKGALQRFDVDAMLDWRTKAPGARRAHPREEHFAPVLVMMGAAHAHGATKVAFPVEAFEYGTLTRRSVWWTKA